MFAVFIIIVLLAVLAVLLYDFLPGLLNWTGRIKIGQISDDGQWLDAVNSVNLKWTAKGAPRVPYDENKRLKLIEEIKTAGKKTTVAYWQDAAVLKGVGDNSGSGANESVSSLVDRYIDIFTGEWKKAPARIDSAILSYEMMSNPFIDNRTIKPAMDYVAEMIKNEYDRCGSVPYNSSVSDIRFVDTVGMICPFLIKYSNEYNLPEYDDIALKQIAQYRECGFDSGMKLPFHCFNTETKAKLGICGWGRGCAWWALGLTDSLKELLTLKGRNKEKALLLRLLMEILDETEKHISDNGAVNRMMLNESLPDSSATAMFAYCFSYMYMLTKKENYRDRATEMLGFLKSVTRRNGVIDFSQGDTMGIGYYSSGLSVVPAAQGFVLAAAELIK